MHDTPLVLLADARESVRTLIASQLTRAGCRVVQVVDDLQAWDKFQTFHFDLVISNFQTHPRDGLSLLRRVSSGQSPNPQTPVLLVSAQADPPSAAEANRAGAADFLAFDESGVDGLVARAVDILKSAEVVLPISLLGESPQAGRLRERAKAFGPLVAPVLICGARGSGREPIARYVHRMSRFASLPFLLVEASTALPMLSRAREGTAYAQDFDRFERADAKRWLECMRESDALGASARLRVIVSSTEPAEALVADGLLTEEEGHLLGRFRIDLPSLRERPEDLPAIIDRLKRRIEQRLGVGKASFGVGSFETLTQYRWRNLAELDGVLESALAWAADGRITRKLVTGALTELEAPLDRIDQARRRAERKQLIELYRKHGTFSGVARELGITRNAAKYRLAKHDLLPR